MKPKALNTIFKTPRGLALPAALAPSPLPVSQLPRSSAWPSSLRASLWPGVFAATVPASGNGLRPPRVPGGICDESWACILLHGDSPRAKKRVLTALKQPLLSEWTLKTRALVTAAAGSAEAASEREPPPPLGAGCTGSAAQERHGAWDKRFTLAFLI